MARLGAFDAALFQPALFAEVLLPAGWFSEDLIPVPAISASLTPVLGALVLVGAAPARITGAVIEPRTP